jgi:uncharacterized protein YxjI
MPEPDYTYNFSVKFDKLSHDLDTDTYIQALTSLSTIMKEANYQLESGEKISINVVAQDTGSFDVGLALVAMHHMFSSDTIQYLSGLVTIAGGLVALRKIWHKADDSKTEINGDQVTIKDIEGNVVYQTNKNTYNIYTTNQVVQDALSNNFKALENDDTITGFELSQSGETVRVDREDFTELAKRVEVKVPDQDVTEMPANLVIVKVVFEGAERKWEFLYNGVKIAAIVVDENFWNEINGGKSFSKGDELIADLRIIREYDPNVDAYINKEYQVVNVRGHNPRSARTQLSIDGIS